MYFFKFKTIFGLICFVFPIFGAKKVFSKNSSSATHNVWHHTTLYRNLMIKKTPRQQDGRMADPISLNTSRHYQRSNKYNCSRLVFKNQNYRVQCLPIQKILHQCQHAKYQINSYTHS